MVGVLVAVFGIWWYVDREPDPVPIAEDEGAFDAFSGGFPVPPMPGKDLPGSADIVAATSGDEGGK